MQEMRSCKNEKPGDHRALEDLQGREVLLQKFLQKRQEYEEKLLERVGQLKRILKDVRSLHTSQPSGRRADLAREIQKDINNTHVLLVAKERASYPPVFRPVFYTQLTYVKGKWPQVRIARVELPSIC